ncbi:hypothetical protein EDD18DRAFT_1423665 [Armillaria luteobubalina]|uniref:Uncharacterized protein n=1 Tax=Armillaria luteobubalina TaxID=153913 RepID=A0AA39UG81_9AGAR|nr:hypothetical protein EDD18DRAFT_1423665 [Armillaria luteobubalina]
MFVLPLLAFISLTSIALAQQYNAEPVVQGSIDDGWQSFPDVEDATAYPQWMIDENIGASLPVYQTAGQDTTEVTRAIIVLHGEVTFLPIQSHPFQSDVSQGSNLLVQYAPLSSSLLAPHRNIDWNSMNNALYKAAYDDPAIKRKHISILGPCFFTKDDLIAGAAQRGQLLYGATAWIDGYHNVAPDTMPGYSSFDVLDALVAYYMDKTIYPNLKVLVVGGHSAGGQTTQRYAILRKSTLDDNRLQFWIANPASLCWLSTDRPVLDYTCSHYDAFKYGLDSNFPTYAPSDADTLGRDGLIDRYHSRVLSYAWGLNDEESGDTRCEAEMQGSTHVERGRNFVAMLEGMGGIPRRSTIDWVPGVSHDAAGMMASDAGIDKLFRYMSNTRK